MKRILLFMAILLSSFGLNAQVGMVGTSLAGWDTDVVMSTTDNVNWTLTGQIFTSGVAKFRLDGGWTTNWGAADFPTGVGTQNGANIPVTAGVYDVAFNSTTGAYSFTVASTFPSLGIIGPAMENGWDGPDVDLTTIDGNIYVLEDYNFLGGQLKIRQDNDWVVNYGGTTFPVGNLQLGGDPMNVPAGRYTLVVNLSLGSYFFYFPSMGMLGTAMDTNGYSGPDANMSTTDGINYILYNYTFTAGDVKFRQDDSWTHNWGSTDFPAGTAAPDGPNIPVTAGSYTVFFNRVTGAYSFEAPIVYDSIGLLGPAVFESGWDGAIPDVAMTTVDGIHYTLENYTFTNGEAKFRKNNDWDFNWGGMYFPVGTAIDNGQNINVTAGTYMVTFNAQTLEYSFLGTPEFPTVGIIGSAVNGWDVPDTNLVTTDGINYSLNGFTYASGEAKLRLDDMWNTSWGSASFPTGGNTGNNIIIPAGTYDLSFNIETGIYTFTASGTWPSVGILGTAVGEGGFDYDIDLTTTDGLIYTLADWTFGAGEAKFRYDDSWDFNFGGDGFPTGPYTQNGNNIQVVPGTYTVVFNRATMTYDFQGEGFASIGMLGTSLEGSLDSGDINMTTSDGINYNLDGRDFVDGWAKFRENDSWDVNWGSEAFPNGFAVANGADIPVVGNRYNVYFNRESGNFSFNYVNIGMIGNAIPVTGWDTDVDMGTSDGINYTFSNITLTDGELKFRENYKWDVNWGSADFPTGTGTQGGANLLVTAGQYDITFNRLTGAYAFVSLGIADFGKTSFTAYPNPSGTTWNFVSEKGNILSVVITDITGKTVIAKENASDRISIEASTLPTGLYLARITGASSVATIKLIRN